MGVLLRLANTSTADNTLPHINSSYLSPQQMSILDSRNSNLKYKTNVHAHGRGSLAKITTSSSSIKYNALLGSK